MCVGKSVGAERTYGTSECIAKPAGEGRDRDGEEAIAAGRWPSVRAGARRRGAGDPRASLDSETVGAWRSWMRGRPYNPILKFSLKATVFVKMVT